MLDLIKQLNLELIHSIDLEVSPLSFEHAIKIYINKPQVVNKWLAGSIKLSDDVNLKFLPVKYFSDQFQIESYQFLTKTSKIFRNQKYLTLNGLQSNETHKFILILPVLSNEVQEESLKFSSISFASLFNLDTNEKSLRIYADKNRDQTQVNWLISTLLPKLKTWSLTVKCDEKFTCTKSSTLTLYPNMLDDYMKLYGELKDIYWSRFSSLWLDQTNTEPEKFIHEDIAIACYLILIWRYFDLNINCFVDIGCGNGLLVYILNDQGHSGYGIDMRSRKIWTNELYTKLNVKLVEKTIEPNGICFENEDWLIGNHSDELSPWLPVLAYKTSCRTGHACNYLLIPCCMFDFNGKFNSKQGKESRNDAYLNFLQRVGEQFDYKVFKDKLRIPSTRNACFVGIFETSGSGNVSSENFNNLISDRINELTQTDSNKLEHFKARNLELEKAKSSRNCTKNVHNDVKMLILKTVFDYLLNDKSNSCLKIKKYDNSSWNAGLQEVSIKEVVNLFDKEILTKLKLECGGLKTLLKNYRQVFDIGKFVRIRVQEEKLDAEKKKFLKTRPCLFEQLHPQGCWKEGEKCAFIHNLNK